MRFSSWSLLLWVLVVSTSAEAKQARPPALCSDAYLLADESKERPLSTSERQLVSDCNDAALHFFILGALGFHSDTLPTPVGRSRLPLEVAFHDLASATMDGNLDASEANSLLAQHGSDGVLALLARTRGTWTTELQSWRISVLLSQDEADRVSCGAYCKHLRCSAIGLNLGLSQRVAERAQARCVHAFSFTVDTENFKAAVLAEATSQVGFGASADFRYSVRDAFRMLGDVRHGQVPSTDLADIPSNQLFPFGVGVVHREATLVHLLRQAADRFFHWGL